MSLFEETLTRYQKNLLDVTSRNRLINSNFTSKKSNQHFGIVDTVPDLILNKFNTGTGTMEFISLPARDDIDEDSEEFLILLENAKLSDDEYLEKIQAGVSEDDATQQLINRLLERQQNEFSIQDHAESNGISSDWILPLEAAKDFHTDRKIRTLMMKNDLLKKLRTINRLYKSSLKEQGVNPLFLSFGYLEWSENPTNNRNSRKFYSPLAMLRVNIEEKDKKYIVTSAGENLIINQSLKEKLKLDFGYELPEIPQETDEDDTSNSLIKDFFMLLEDHLENHDQNWKLRKWGSLGVYNSQNFPIYLDLEEIKGKPPSRILKKFFESSDEENVDANSSEIYDVDSLEQDGRRSLPELVIDADASQYSAVIAACEGEDFVIKGPPGTGKSQTITNTIAALMQQGKSVLFVAQKQAALDVVRNNLIDVGLKPFLLDIFSIRSDKKAVMKSFAERLDFTCPRVPVNEYQTIKERLKRNKRELNQYKDQISKEIGNTGINAHDIIWNRYKHKNPFNEELEFDDSLFEDIALQNDDSLIQIKDELQQIKQRFDEDIESNENLNYFSEIKVYYTDPREKLEDIQLAYDFIMQFIQRKCEYQARNEHLETIVHDKKVYSLIKQIILLFQDPNKSTFLEIYLKDQHYEDLKKAIKINKSIIFLEDWENFEALNKIKEKFKKAKKTLKESKNYLNQTYLNPPKKEEFNAWKNIFEESGILYFLSFKYRKAKKEFNEICNVSQNHSKKQILDEIKKTLNTINSISRKEKEIKNLNIDIKRFEEKRNDEISNNKAQLQILKTRLDSTYENFSLKKSSDFYDSEEFKLLDKKLGKSNLNFMEDLLPENDLDLFKEYFEFLEENEEEVSRHYELYNELTDGDEREIVFEDDLLNFFKNISNPNASLEGFFNWQLYINEDQENLLSEEYGQKLIDFFIAYLEKGLELSKIFKTFDYLLSEKRIAILNDAGFNTRKRGSTLDEYIKKFKRDDKRLKEISRKLLIETISDQERDAPLGSGNRVSEKTEKNLIEYVSTRPGTRVSVRDIFSRATRTIRHMKPCVMMSPFTVSQTLSLENKFDVLLIDEASQMKPEYAMGALARTKQVIVVGDNNQLPPTDFFQRDNDDDDEDFESESILDLALTSFRNPRDLIYHYRSRHEDLIKFSNEKFYNNLLIPCSASPLDQERGIRYIYLDEAVYLSSSGGSGGRVNPLEAKKIVDIVEELITSRPNESIGVATINNRQRDYIQNELDLRKLQNDELSNYIDDWAERDEGINDFFIKNLENVQGDERDIIIVGTLFGKNETGGPPFQRFGAIAKPNGWRRLNVLFTRAKNQMIVVSSIKSHEIKERDDAPRGTKIFKEYLYYVESGEIVSGEPFQAEIDNPFQQWAIDQINAIPGFSADWEIGEQGYRIDIGVKHESYPGYILAVETDGATYHSSLCARDRDILRQQILEGYGWKFHRIWSTDWLRDPHAERQKLHDALNERLLSLGNP